MDGVIADTRDVKIRTFKEVLTENGFRIKHTDNQLLVSSRPSEVFIQYSKDNYSYLSQEYSIKYEYGLHEAKAFLNPESIRLSGNGNVNILLTSQPMCRVVATFQALFGKAPRTYFNNIISEEDLNGHGKGSKYSSEIVSNTIRTLSQGKVVKVIVIGDSPSDILCAQKIEAISIAVTWGYHHPRDLRLFNPDFIVSTRDELQSIISLEK